MPTRSRAQKIGDAGQALVERWFDHPLWLARQQGRDFGIDLEVELAEPLDGDKQRMTGKLLKLQIKTKERVEVGQAHVAFPVDRNLIHYADAFRLPVILTVACLDTGTVWWLWLQEWAMLHDERLRRDPTSNTVTAHIPIQQTLEHDLVGALPAIALGSVRSSMVLTLRNMIEAATGWEHQQVAEGVAKLLGEIDGESRGWTLRKVTDKLLGLGQAAPFWEAQQILPVMMGLIDVAGDSFTTEQVVQLVAREDTYSRTGVLGLSRLYDRWPEHMRGLGLVDAFKALGLADVAWLCAMRERYPIVPNASFAMSFLDGDDRDTEFDGYQVELTAEVRDYIFAKWPTRGDTVLLDCLAIANANSLDEGG
ncbi:DUF4365 domain-containing protein [Citromicrobium bathyomarinum]|uniref:DUF4365 domain-containing protein n=1 Tax=Citromicrobium bathyomarinum TaxID=72174 RepID=UPI00315B27D4